MYLPGIKTSDDIVSWWGDAPARKCPDTELLHHTAFQNTGGHRTRVAAVTLDNMAERVSAQREDLP